MTVVSWVQLGDLADLRAGVGFPLSLQGKSNGKYPFAKVGDISRCARSGEVFLSTAENYIDASEVDALSTKPIPEGSILFAKIGEAIRQNFRVLAGCELLIDNNAMAAIPKKEVRGKYLFYYLKSVDFYLLAPSTTVPAIRKSDLQKLPIPIFSLDEQDRIVDILDRAEILRAKRRAAMAELNKLAQSIYIDMFGDPADNPKNWIVKSLREVVEEFRYGTSEKSGEGAVPVLRIPNVAKGKIDTSDLKYVNLKGNELQRLVLRGGDLLFVRTNGNPNFVGRCAVFEKEKDDEDFAFASYLIRARLDLNVVVPEFVCEFLLGVTGRRLMLAKAKTSAGQYNINIQGLGSVLIPIPPLSLQQAFCQKLTSVKKLASLYLDDLSKLDALLASLQHRAFRGEL